MHSITAQAVSQMAHFFGVNEPLDPKMQNSGKKKIMHIRFAYLGLRSVSGYTFEGPFSLF